MTPNTVAFAVTTAPGAGIGNSELRLAKTFNDAINATTNPNDAITINNKGGALKVVSRVSDKNCW